METKGGPGIWSKKFQRATGHEEPGRRLGIHDAVVTRPADPTLMLHDRSDRRFARAQPDATCQNDKSSSGSRQGCPPHANGSR